MPHPIKRESGPYVVVEKFNGMIFYPVIEGPRINGGVVLTPDGMAMALNTAYAAGRRSVEAKKGGKK